jgi:selenocysteine lyase/cysteine desulfurase
LNCAHQGPLPKVAAASARRAIRQKMTPQLISENEFDEVPRQLRQALATLIDRPCDEIILGNSATFGIDLIANGIPWKSGDEILLVKGDFPATTVPWMGLRVSGVRLRFVSPANGRFIEVADVEHSLNTNTKALCVSWVNSYSGWKCDVQEIGRVCQEHGVLFVVNGTQGIGRHVLNLSSGRINAIVCSGYKWLCGPYATGFCWLDANTSQMLRKPSLRWWPLRKMDIEHIPEDDAFYAGPQFRDVFCSANCFNFCPWSAAIKYLTSCGIDNVERYGDALVAKLLNGIDGSVFQVISAASSGDRSGIVVVSHADSTKNPLIFDHLAQSGFDIALRKGNLRISPHLYNSQDEIDRFARCINQHGRSL